MIKASLALFFAAFALLRVAVAQNALPNVTIVVPAGPESSVTKLAIERLQDYGGFVAQVRPSANAVDREPALILILGSPQEHAACREAWAGHPAPKPDAYVLKAIAARPLTIVVSGRDERGTLFAAYHLADLLKSRRDLATLDVFREPRIAERFVSFGATMNARRDYVPEQHWKTLKELPAFGYNGIVIYPGGGTPIGRRSSPIVENDDGSLQLTADNTARWKAWFAELKKYRLDLMMTVPPVIPPGYERKAIAAYYAGGPEPRGYLPALQAHFRRYLELLTSAYPELDKFMFNSTEGATFGRNERFFGRPGRHPVASYLRNNEAVMRAYFDVLGEFFKNDPRELCFWTHSFGLTSEGIVRMREVLFEYPRVTIIEDDFWNNNLWPTDLPAMAYLPPALRERVSRQNPFALFQIATDGEYYGGGSLPAAYPGSHIRSAREALARGARMVIQRLDLHARTPYGTAFGPMKIVPYAASQQLWQPTPEEPEIWRQWAATRFGPAAAEAVIRALQESHTVLIEGLSCNGIDLLAVGSEFQPRLWMKDNTGVTRYFLFGKPGERLVRKAAGDVITSGEYTAWQSDTRSIAIGDFRRRQENARAAAERGLACVEQAKAQLAPADYDLLRRIFADGVSVLRAVRLLGELAYATNLCRANFDRVADPQRAFRAAFEELDAFLREERLLPPMTRNIRTIMANYRAVANGEDPRMSDDDNR